MRFAAIVASLLAAMLVTPALASDLTDVERTLHRSTVQDFFNDRPKTLCVCQDGSGNDGLVGFVYHWSNITSGGLTRIAVNCEVTYFDATGNLVIGAGCYKWEALPK